MARNFTDRRTFLQMGIGAGTLFSTRPAFASSPEVIVGKDGWLFPAFDQVSWESFAQLSAGASLINECVEILAKGGVKTIICLTPAKSRIYSEYLPADVKPSADATRRYAFDLESLRKAETMVPDLAEAFSLLHKTQPQTELFFKGDTHWTPQGAACAAKAIADLVKSKALLPPSATPGVRLGPPRETMQSRNDLANLLPPEMKAKYPLEHYKLPQAAEDAGSDLLADDGADTVCVGNSYLHPSLGFSVLLSNLLNRPVWLVWKIHAFSPYWNLLDYLKSAAFKAQRPKLLVWVFHETDLNKAPNDALTWGETSMKRDVIIDDLRRHIAV